MFQLAIVNSLETNDKNRKFQKINRSHIYILYIYNQVEIIELKETIT